jgi:acetyl esterase/lipase
MLPASDYRLAPEHPFPAALDDIRTAYLWLLQQRIDPSQVIFAGDSTGAAITLALLLRCRDEGVPLPAGAVLFCPAPSIDGTPSARIRTGRSSAWSAPFGRAAPTPTSPGTPPTIHSSARY